MKHPETILNRFAIKKLKSEQLTEMLSSFGVLKNNFFQRCCLAKNTLYMNVKVRQVQTLLQVWAFTQSIKGRECRPRSTPPCPGQGILVLVFSRAKNASTPRVRRFLIMRSPDGGGILQNCRMNVVRRLNYSYSLLFV